VDAGMTGLTTIPSRKLYEVMDHLTLTNHADVEFMVIINDKVWQGLNDAERGIMAKAAARVEHELRGRIEKEEADSLEFARGKMKVVALTPQELEAWRKATASVVDVYKKDAGPLGEKLVSEAQKLK
jgi:C4-dicarboxylate-binding protein DctP